MSKLSTDDPHDKYDLVELLGEGSYGAVYKAINKQNNDAECAIKILPAEEDMSKLEAEIEFLKKMGSPYVVSFVEGYNFEGELWIVMEYCAGGSMSDIYEATNRVLKEAELRSITAYCVLGLHHLHSHRSIHRDVKAGNVLLASDGTAKLADFGVSAELTNTMQKRKTMIGTPFWMAPEVIQETSYDGRADIWSLGITLIELCEGQPPHYNVHPMRAIFMIPMKPAPKLKEPSKWSAEMENFLSRCLQKNPDERATSEELLQHPWIVDDVNKILSGEGCANLKKFFDDNIDAVQRMRDGEEPPEDEKEEEKDRTIKRDATLQRTSTLLKKKNRDSSLRLASNTMTSTDSSVFTINASGTMRGPVLDTGPTGTLKKQSNTETDLEPRLTDLSEIHMDMKGGRPPRRHSKSSSLPEDDEMSGYGTMKFSSTMQRGREASDAESVTSEVSAALKYFQRAPSLEAITGEQEMNKLMHAIDKVAIEAKDACSAEDLALQELETQMWLLEKQYKEDAEELRRAYTAKQKILETSLKKLRTELRRSDPQMLRLKAEMNIH
mmetsp:Transcript_3239/g.5031  ORF Transcript_3239/g.5031 Transcript_3239/m.5031 type:complete len:553 (+) Transcript_3239:87-1745(+)|eukprot:CAMPEP_0185025156 /NCGR_PEP_ID=MMETSP1103-20130426/8223_1 /TAXON_ID=36769 /ORGANISM="Paraphysomonas bandaiensis, Strain Caron Lab Isolate" /LENGTH=552 /DNA_ID=CAMNT_0027558293 /DNA_START=84 /DNA_END=1742 /DNA_ORIENTATION=+